MKARAFALMIIAVLIWAMAAAGSADDIDNCCFVDRQCNSDQDWTDGYWAFQNNQCPAPAQSPASASSQSVSAAPAQIDNVDNCCFVNRQCSNELEWEAGYYAYQNNQCAAPGQSAGSAPGAPESARIIGYTSGSIQPSTSFTKRPTLDSGPISFGNCCEMNWQCNSDEDWNAGHNAFQNNQCQLPGSVISIVGDADFVDYMTTRLEELRNGMPERYHYALSALNKLQQASPDLLGGFVDERGRTFYVPWSGPRSDGFETRLSAVIVHEACHVHRADAGHVAYACDLEGSIREELICREIELEVVIGLGAAPHVIDWVRDMVARTPETLRRDYPESLC